jgi:hypothetical protein
MPRPGEVSNPLYEGLPYGANALANDMSEDIPDDDLFDDGFDELADFNPQPTSEQFLFSGTDRPDEPLTAGMSFGEGPNISAALVRGESKQQFAMRVSRELSAAGGQIKGVQAFADRIAKGL